MTYKTLQTNFERELIFQILTSLRKRKISTLRAKEISQVFMPVLKNDGAEEFIEALAKLSRYYPEILEAFIEAVKIYEKETVEEKLTQARDELTKGGDN